MADVIPFPSSDPEAMESARLRSLMDGELLTNATMASMGTPADWGWSAAAYLKARQSEMAAGGRMFVSIAAVASLLVFLEDLAEQLDLGGPGDGPDDPDDGQRAAA